MNTPISHRTARRRLGAVAVAVASLAFVDGMPVAAVSAPAVQQPAVEAAPALPSAVSSARVMPTGTGYVLNNFVRDCSRFSRRCTGYRQTNGPYSPYVGSRYFTRWVWRWI